MNSLALHIAINGHLTFKQKLRHGFLKIFGHESLFDVNDLRLNSHCGTFDIDIYRIGDVHFSHLAYRKLFNPFKWVQLVIITPLEMAAWLMHRYAMKKREFSNNEFIFLLQIGYELFIKWIAAIVYVVTDIIKCIVNCIFSPINSIIRPSINMAITKPRLFGLIVGVTVIAAVSIALALFTGGTSLFLGGALLANTLGSQIGVMAILSAAIWSAMLKLVNFAGDFIDVIRMKNKVDRAIENNDSRDNSHQSERLYVHESQTVEIFKNGSTEKITQMLHGINPDLAEVRPVNDQNMGYTASLLTGTESLFYKKKKAAPPFCESHRVSYGDLFSVTSHSRASRSVNK